MTYLNRKKGAKIVVSGLADAGTTTIAESISTGHPPKELTNYQYTIDHERHRIKIGDLEITIMDLGGQTSFQDRFTGESAEWVFSGVRSFVWVISSRDPPIIARSLYYFNRSINHLVHFSPRASLFVLQHKIDISPPSASVRREFHQALSKYDTPGTNLGVDYYETSIFSGSFKDFLARIIDVTVSGRTAYRIDKVDA